MQPLTIWASFHILGARSSVDRVLASEAKGRRFDSCRARQLIWGFAPVYAE
jgi:hypothetical protein